MNKNNSSDDNTSYMSYMSSLIGKVGSLFVSVLYSSSQDSITNTNQSSQQQVVSLSQPLSTSLSALSFKPPTFKPPTFKPSSNKPLTTKPLTSKLPTSKSLTPKTQTTKTSTNKVSTNKTLTNKVSTRKVSTHKEPTYGVLDHDGLPDKLPDGLLDGSLDGLSVSEVKGGKHTNYGTKEKAVADYIKNEFIGYDWICGKSVGASGCRPDVLLMLPNYNIVIEIDENQHSSYNVDDESHRMKQIHKDLKCKDIVFIRFNPDTYTNVKGERVTSCWRQIKSGIIKVSKPSEWPTRLKTLNATITHWLNHTPTKPITVVKLYYDGYK